MTRVAGWVRTVFGVFVFAAAAITLAPAAIVDAPLAMRTQERLRLADAGGFWWRGHGLVTTADGTARLPIAWRVAALSFVQRTMVIRLVETDAAAPTGTITIGRGRVDIRDLHLRVPAAIAGSSDPRLQAVALGGTVTVDSPSFIVGPTARTGVIHATWDRARVAAGDAAADLGLVSLDATPAGDGLTGTIRNSAGDLSIDGTLADRSGMLEVTLALRPTAAAPENVRRGLPLLGVPDGSGGVRVHWRSGP